MVVVQLGDRGKMASLEGEQGGRGRHACLPLARPFFLAPKYFHKKAPSTQATSVLAGSIRCFGGGLRCLVLTKMPRRLLHCCQECRMLRLGLDGRMI